MKKCACVHYCIREYFRDLYFIAEVPVPRELTRRSLDEDDGDDVAKYIYI